MRVHSGATHRSLFSWHILAVLGIVCLLISAGVYWAPLGKLKSFLKVEQNQAQVVVVYSKIEAGEPLDSTKLKVEKRPAKELPPDALSSISGLDHKVALVPIPAGYPLSLALVASPVAVRSLQEDPNFRGKVEDPAEMLMRMVESDTVAVTLPYEKEVPRRGSRVAVTLTDAAGNSSLLAEDGWVSSGDGGQVTLRVDAKKALLLQSAPKYGMLGLLELPADGPSPFEGKAIRQVSDLLKVDSQGSRAPALNWSWVN